MPLLQNAKKALRSSRKKAIFNSRVKSILKTMLDRIKSDPTKDNLSSAFSSIDTAVKKNLIHRNKAGRMKVQLNKLVKTSSVPKAKKKATKKVVVSKKSAKSARGKKITKAKASVGKK